MFGRLQNKQFYEVFGHSAISVSDFMITCVQASCEKFEEIGAFRFTSRGNESAGIPTVAVEIGFSR